MINWIKKRLGRIIVLGAILIYALYETSTYLFVYTDDAYVTTDMVSIAPEVPGVLQALRVTHDQPVKEAKSSS